MFAPNTLRRLAVLALSLALLVPAAIHSGQKAKNHHSQKQKIKKEKRRFPQGYQCSGDSLPILRDGISIGVRAANRCNPICGRSH